jgi:hypothetical protein
MALADDGIDVQSRLVAMEGGYHGHEGSRAWWPGLSRCLSDFNPAIERSVDLSVTPDATTCSRTEAAEVPRGGL